MKIVIPLIAILVSAPAFSQPIPQGRCVSVKTRCPGGHWVTSSCSGTQTAEEICGIKPRSSVSGTYSPQEEAAKALGQAIGAELGKALNEAIFGNPEQEAARRAQADRAEALWRQAEEARKNRLLAEMQGMENTDLSLMMDSDSSGELALMTGDDAPRRAPGARNPGSALHDLNRASWISQQAWKAESLEQAVEMGDAAFQAAVGGVVDVVVPQNVIAAPATPVRQNEFESLRRRYFESRDAAFKDGDSLVGLEYQREVAARLRADAEKKITELEKAGANAEQLVKARKLRDDSRNLEKQVNGRIQRAVEDARLRQVKANESAQELRNSISPNPGIPKAEDKDKRFENASFVKGYMDAHQCFSSNAGLFCNGEKDQAFNRCLNNYRAGYGKGEKLKEQMIQNATASGRKDRDGGVRASGPAQLGAQGSCRITWIEAYNDGYFRAKPNLIGR
jgi:hypothetical protein